MFRWFSGRVPRRYLLDASSYGHYFGSVLGPTANERLRWFITVRIPILRYLIWLDRYSKRLHYIALNFSWIFSIFFVMYTVFNVVICCFRFVLVNAAVIYFYVNNFQNIDEEEYGGLWEITKEGFMTSFAGFLVSYK